MVSRFFPVPVQNVDLNLIVFGWDREIEKRVNIE